jgi:hypothetical protein
VSSAASQRKPRTTPRTRSELLMARETRIAYGPVPRSLFGEPLGETTWQMLDDGFLLRGEGDHYFHYRVGEGITIERGEALDLSEESLWLNGSVYSAIASLNGLLPIHASAVAFDGRVFAFTGPAGAGKSTLVAALGDRGFPMFCDDTLVLDLSNPDRIICLPGHKRLKLTPQALELTGAARQEKVSRTVDKFYASSAAGDAGVAMPLAKLIFLEDGAEPALRPIAGAERFMRMQDEHQTARLFAAARRFGRADHFAHLSRLARQIQMIRFIRPQDISRFRDGISLAARFLASEATKP